MREVKEIEKPYYPHFSPTKVTTMGNITEVVTMAREAEAPPIRKLSKDLYEYLPTGEVFEYEHGETRADNLGYVRRTMANIRALINTNVTDPKCCRWVTLTYADNMTDTKVLYQDYKKFWKKFCYWCEKQGYEKPEYITVQEPQGRGAWHVHAFFIWPEAAPFIPNNEVMAKLWGHGFTKTQALEEVDNIGAYFSAYLADMPLDEYQALPDYDPKYQIEVKEFENAQDLTKTKRFVKGGRLRLYPVGMNILRRSRGIKDPEVERMTYGEAQKKVSSAKLTFSRSYEISDNHTVCNTITKAYYNSKRK